MSAGNLLQTFFILFQSDGDKMDKAVRRITESIEQLDGKLKNAGGARRAKDSIEQLDSTLRHAEGARSAKDSTEQLDGKLKDVAGAKRAKESIEQLDGKLKDMGKSSRQAGESFSSLAKKAADALRPFVGLTAVKGAVLDFAANAEAAGKLAAALRMDVEELQAWQGAAARVGGSAEGMAGSIKALNGKLEEMRRTGGGEAAGAMHQLGVSLRDNEGRVKTADKMLLDLADKFAGLSGQQAMGLGKKFGLDEGTVDLLRKGREGVEDMLARQRELGGYTKEDTESARSFNEKWSEMQGVFGKVSDVIARMMLPLFKDISGGITSALSYILKYEDLVKGFFIALSVVFGVLAVKALIISAPFLLLAGVVLALSLAFAVLYDDIMNFLGGHGSVIGRLSKDYPWIAELVHDIVDVLSMLWEIAQAAGTMLVEAVSGPAQAWENFTNKVNPLLDALTEKFPELGQAVKDLGAVFQWLAELVWPVLKGIGKLVQDVLGFILECLAKIGALLGKGLQWAAGKIKGEAEIKINEPEQLRNQDAPGQQAQGREPDPDEAELRALLDKPPPVLTGKQPGALPDYREPGHLEQPKQPVSREKTADPLSGFKTPKQPPATPPVRNTELPAELLPGTQPLQQPDRAGLPALAPGSREAFKNAPFAPAGQGQALYGQSAGADLIKQPKAYTDVHLPGKLPADLQAGIAAGKQAVLQTNAPIASMAQAAADTPKNITRHTTINVGKVEVHTQAVDAGGMAHDAANALEKELRNAVDNFDDGVMA